MKPSARERKIQNKENSGDNVAGIFPKINSDGKLEFPPCNHPSIFPFEEQTK
jgi:hypothetical protein